MSGREQGYVQQVFDSNWIAPLGSLLDFELRNGLATVEEMM